MAKVRAERQENLLAISLGEAALEIAREHLPEHVAEILANLRAETGRHKLSALLPLPFDARLLK